MARSREKIFKEVLHLSEEERLELTGLLIESLDKSTDDNVEKSWITEVEKRIQALDSGTEKTIPWEDIKDKIFKRA